MILDVGTVEADTQNAVASVSVGRFDAGHCVIERLLLYAAARPVRVGIDADASNIVIAFSGYTQFYAVMWDAPTGVRAAAGHRVDQSERRFPRRAVAVEFAALLERCFARQHHRAAVRCGAFGDHRRRGQLGAVAEAAKTADATVCGAFANTHRIDLENEAVWELRAPDAAAPTAESIAFA